MCVLYLTGNNNSLEKSGSKLVLRDAGILKNTVPLKLVESIVVSGNANISTTVIRSLLLAGKDIVYTDWRGNYEGMLHGLRVSRSKMCVQMERTQDSENTCAIAKYIVSRKIANQVAVLRDYARYRKDHAIKQVALKLEVYAKKLDSIKALNEIRGIEGLCAREYFAVWERVIDKKTIKWRGRNRKPALDPVNALLNYGYAFLEREVRLSIVGEGLDERFGFLHTNNGRKDSLVYDLMELFRQPVIDRLVMNCFSRKMMKAEDFVMEKDECLLTPEGRKKWIKIYEKTMDDGGRASIRGGVKLFVMKLLKEEWECVG